MLNLPAFSSFKVSCRKHPAYKGIRIPHNGCASCMQLFNLRETFKYVAKQMMGVEHWTQHFKVHS